MSRFAATAAALVLLASGHAKSEQLPAWLARFDVVSGCGETAAFADAVAGRVSRPLDVVFAGLRLEVSIENSDRDGAGGLLGKLQITNAAGSVSAREVRAGSCAELIEALSLVAALSADGERRDANDAPLSAPSDDAPSVRANEPQDRAPTEPGGDESKVVRLGPSAYALLQDVATPKPAFGVGLGLAIAWPTHGPWAPWLQVGGYQLRGGESSIAATSIRAHFDLLAAHAIACPIRVPANGVWSLRPCAELDVGRLSGSGGGSAISHPTDRRGLWASSGLALRAELSPWAPVSLSTSFGAVVPWTRHEFFFAPDTLAFRVPSVGFRGTLSAALMF